MPSQLMRSVRRHAQSRPDRLAADVVGAIQAWSRRHRVPILGAAAAAFGAGLTLAVRDLGLSPTDLDLRTVMVILVVAAPVSIIINAFELQLCALAVGRRLSLGRGIAVSTTATVANLLPLPAGVAVRSAALIAAGAKLHETGTIVLAAALMWFAMAASITGLAFVPEYLLGWFITAAGPFVVLGIAFWIARRSDVLIAFGFVVVRAALLAIFVWRIWLAFAALDLTVPLLDAAVYAAAGIAGTVVMIIPAGLGVSEGFGALLAEAVGGSAAAAFLAIGLNRILGLSLAGIVAGIAWGIGIKLS